MKKIFVLYSVLVLAGCAEYKWKKIGANDHDLAVDRTECKAQSLKALPPDNVISGTHGGVKKGKNNKDKLTDLRFDVRDANEDNRQILEDDCMYRKGWSRKEFEFVF